MARMMPRGRFGAGAFGIGTDPQKAGDLTSAYEIRQHLERRLWQTEAHIHMLSHELGISGDGRVHTYSWHSPRLAEGRSASWASLGRLVAARETLIEALRAL